jgi:hypothetical protein
MFLGEGVASSLSIIFASLTFACVISKLVYAEGIEFLLASRNVSCKITHPFIIQQEHAGTDFIATNNTVKSFQLDVLFCFAAFVVSCYYVCKRYGSKNWTSFNPVEKLMGQNYVLCQWQVGLCDKVYLIKCHLI